MLAFAGNSLICRLALRDGAIDPASFTSVRLAAGAISLLAIFLLSRRGESLRGHGSWLSALSLFVYATCFSYAYITLRTTAILLRNWLRKSRCRKGYTLGSQNSSIPITKKRRL